MIDTSRLSTIKMSLYPCIPVTRDITLFYYVRKFYQQDDETDERGIEYDRLIEMPDHSPKTTPGKNDQLILNERERHLISNKLYSEYAEDQDRYDRLKEDEVG